MMVDLDGMDRSWNSSQWVSLRHAEANSDSEESDSSIIAQLDGLVDGKRNNFTSLLYVMLFNII